MLTCITLHLALDGYSFHKLAFPSLPFPLTVYICNQILAADVLDIRQAVRRDPLLIQSLCVDCHFPSTEGNYFFQSDSKKYKYIM